MAEPAKAAGKAAGKVDVGAARGGPAEPARKTAAAKSAASKTPGSARKAVTKASGSTAAAAGKTRRAAKQVPGESVQAPPTAAGSAAKGATMAKRADTKSTTGRKPVVKAARSAKETEKIRDALTARCEELRAEYDQTLSEINELQRDRLTDSAGDDQADTGTKTFEREQEISLANGILERITQVERALERLDEGSYGWCERCGNQIPVERLAAFPSATLCVSCKQLEERR